MNSSSLLKFVGRTMIGATVGYLGYGALTEPGGRVAVAKNTIAKMRKVVPIPLDDEAVVRTNGGIMVASGAMLSLGVLPKAAASVIAVVLVPTTIAGHAFWKMDKDDPQRNMQKTQVVKNIAIMGGLVYIIASK